MSSHKKLSLSTMIDMDGGKPVAAFDFELLQVIRDMTDRPGDATARKVSLVVDLIPVCDTDSVTGQPPKLVDVDVTLRFAHSIPKRKTRGYRMRPGAGGLLFEPESPDDPTQLDISTLIDPAKKEEIDKSTGEVHTTEPPIAKETPTEPAAEETAQIAGKISSAG